MWKLNDPSSKLHMTCVAWLSTFQRASGVQIGRRWRWRDLLGFTRGIETALSIIARAPPF
jgi:hypothetical protein